MNIPSHRKVEAANTAAHGFELTEGAAAATPVATEGDAATIAQARARPGVPPAFTPTTDDQE